MRNTIPALLLAGMLPFVSGCVGTSLGPIELGIVGLIAVLLPFLALIDIFRSSRRASEKAIFVLLIFVLPIIGLVVYFLLRGEE